MVRLTRAEQQARTRSSVLAAAAEEFACCGYAEAKVDRIAARAELTRGAVYSNFASKRSLYLAVLLDSVPAGDEVPGAPPAGVAAAAEAFARVWLERLPLAGDTAADGGLRSRSLAGVFDDQAGRAVLGQLARLEALLLALALESAGPGGRRVRLAELILTLLHGTADLARSAPGFGDPFDVAAACRHLAAIELADTGDPPHLGFVGPPDRVREAWTAPAAPAAPADVLTGRPLPAGADGLVVVLGPARLAAAEEAVRSAAPVTVAVVTTDPAETGALVRLRLTDLAGCLRRVFPAAAAPSVRLVLDDSAALATAAGIDPAQDTEAAVRIRGGEIVARAHGRGAAHAVAERS